uniref:Uncharacterized protein n=1 Tax=Glossina pallidipes TaxID=7398 RepID=A0A1B0A488_GLOPL
MSMSKIVIRAGIGLGLAYLFIKYRNYLERCDHDKACDNIGFCGLFHLCHMHHIPKSLKNLLEDKEIIKVGIDPAADAQKLQEDYGIYRLQYV